MRQHDCKHCILCETWIFQIILTNLLDLSLSRMGVRQLAAPRSSLLVLNKHAETSNDVLQFFHLQSLVTCLLVDAVLLMHQWGMEMNKRSIYWTYWSTGFTAELKKRTSQTRTLISLWCCFCVSDPVSLICHCRAVTVQDVSMGPTPTSAATRLQALHLFLYIGAVTVLRSKTNLIETLTNHPRKDRYWQFHPLQCYLSPLLWGLHTAYIHPPWDIPRYSVHWQTQSVVGIVR